MPPQIAEREIARGPGPSWLRVALAVLAGLYFLTLFTGVPYRGVLRPIAFFVEAPGLFPEKDQVSFEFKLEGWSCARREWLAMDPRPYFPIEADNKESRFYRTVWFFHYKESLRANERTVMNALDDYIVEHHPATDDALPEPIGGIRVYETWRELPPPGDDTPRYEYAPIAPLAPGEQRKEIYNTKLSTRKERCKDGAT